MFIHQDQKLLKVYILQFLQNQQLSGNFRYFNLVKGFRETGMGQWAIAKQSLCLSHSSKEENCPLRITSPLVIRGVMKPTIAAHLLSNQPK